MCFVKNNFVTVCLIFSRRSVSVVPYKYYYIL
nr:MAG TPA: hypothetical protein [Caudoviricetes sp.]